MLACRLTSATIVFNAGNILAPAPRNHIGNTEEEQCRLYYYRFHLSDPLRNEITHQFALSCIPCEFPTVRNSNSMVEARYVYGCSVSGKSFGVALGSVRINSLLKIDALRLIAQGIATPPTPITGCVDMRTADEVLAADDPDDAIRIFKLPPLCYAQECRFVSRANSVSEDDGWLLSYVFDESQLDHAGNALPNAKSELWIIDARTMCDVVAKIKLPQRVPYGLHGSWFPEEEVANQRPVARLRKRPHPKCKTVVLPEAERTKEATWLWAWLALRMWIIGILG
jgi:carotenoid cleavage dioxygenase-like enzyme